VYDTPDGNATGAGGEMKVRGSVLDCIGQTPVCRLGALSRALGVELLGKAEYLNPGGSLKDRVALAMVRQAEADGLLVPGSTLVEATAGNTGIGLALVAAALGYRFIAVMTEADRGPKSEAMEAMGGEVAYTRPGLPWDGEHGPLGVAARIARERGGVFLNQFANPANPRIHETTTAVEIAESVGGLLDVLVVGVGTGGTATGLARGLKPRFPRLRVLGVAADGSYLGSGRPGDRIAGITPDFAPATFDPALVDGIEAVTAEEAARAARRIGTIEGLPVGHSSGACLVAAEREARRSPGATILFLLGDSVRNYPRLGL
jgi:cysteine synthase